MLRGFPLRPESIPFDELAAVACEVIRASTKLSMCTLLTPDYDVKQIEQNRVVVRTYPY